MLDCRKEGFDRVNRHYGTNWTVELNPDIDYVNMFTDPKVDIRGEENEEEVQND